MEINSNEIMYGSSAVMPGQIWFIDIGDKAPVITMTKNRPHLILSATTKEIVCLPLTHQNSPSTNWRVPIVTNDKGQLSYILMTRPVTLYLDSVKPKMKYYTTLSPKLFRKVVATFLAAMFSAYFGDDMVTLAGEAVSIFNEKNEYNYMSFMPYNYYSIDGVMDKINGVQNQATEAQQAQQEPQVQNQMNTENISETVIEVLKSKGLDVEKLAKLSTTPEVTEVTTPKSEDEKTDKKTKPAKHVTKSNNKNAKTPKVETKSAPQINLDEYVSMTQAINEFGLTRGAAAYMTRCVDSIKVGRQRLMKRSDCEAFLSKKKKHKPYAKRNASASDAKISTATAVVEDTETDERVQSVPIKIKNRKEFVKGMIVPVCDLDKTTSTSVYEIANAFRNITGNDMTWSEAKGIMNNLCIENHDIKHRDFSSTEFSVKLTMAISEGQKKLKVRQIIDDIKTYGEEIAKRKWSIDDAFIEINCKETCK